MTRIVVELVALEWPLHIMRNGRTTFFDLSALPLGEEGDEDKEQDDERNSSENTADDDDDVVLAARARARSVRSTRS